MKPISNKPKTAAESFVLEEELSHILVNDAQISEIQYLIIYKNKMDKFLHANRNLT